MDVATSMLAGFDGAPLAVHQLGPADGRPVLLLHGLFSSAEVNWIKYGTAALLAGQGLRCIMPDLRAHGASAKPHDPAAYPPDVLVRDAAAIASRLGLDDFDLCGFSLGARTALHAVTSGALRPRRLVLAGMGLAGLREWDRRIAHFLDVIARFGTIPREDPAYMAQNFMRSTKVDLVAGRLLLESFRGAARDDLSAVTMPTLLVCGVDDHDNGSAEELAAALPDARYHEVPGTHLSSVTRPEFGEAIVAFLTR